MTKKLWGGRFKGKTDPFLEEFAKSIRYDFKLAEHDIAGSLEHVRILKKAGYLTAPEASGLTNGLKELLKGFKSGKLKIDLESEDIHTCIQNLLEKRVGNLALKLHTARSRNDQVVYATKSYCKKELVRVAFYIAELEMAICSLAGKNKGIVIPGYTHLQHAQPVLLGDYLIAYLMMLKRDGERLLFIADSINPTLGSGALAGTPIKRRDYGTKATPNSIYTVSDRGFIIEIIAALSILATDLSRFAEDLIIWSTKEFGFVEIDDAFCTGSSLMPQKKNPDALELIRGYAARCYGNLMSVLVMMKGLPLTYNRDMQLDKEPLFNSFETATMELKILTGLVRTLKFNKDRIDEQLKDESLYATDLVYYLVGKSIPFKKAHDIIGRLVRYSLDNDIPIKDMPEGTLKRFSDKLIKKEIIRLFDPLVSVKSKRSIRR